MLHPFRPLLAGSVLVVGTVTADLVAALRATARSVTAVVPHADAATASAERPLESGPPLDGARYDAVILSDPAASAWGGPDEPGSDRLAQALGRAAGLLRPNGHLIVVVENALSLRHFAGHPEAASAPEPFGLDERAGPNGFVPPTRRGLRARLAGLGLTEQDWWFPFPDHRLVLSLVAERGLAEAGAFDPGILAADSAAFDPGGSGRDRLPLRRAWTGVARAGLLGDLAPAFAVAASATALPPDARLALHFGHRRRPAFDKVVGFVREGDTIRVTRAPLHPDLPRVVEGVTNRFPDEPFVPGATWQAGLQALLARDGWTVADIVVWATVWRDAVRALHAGGADLSLDTPLPGDAIDAIPRNLMHRDGVPIFIDAEWEIDGLGFGHLLVRALINAFTDVEACGTPGPGPEPALLPLVLAVAEGLGVPLDAAALDAALARESRFQSTVSGVATRRNRAWLAATRLPLRMAPPDPLADRDRTIARLHGAVAALRAEGENRVAAVTEELEESRRRTDRVIRYAAELDRERGRLALALAEMQGRDRPLEEDRRRRRPLWAGRGILTSTSSPQEGGATRAFTGAVRALLAGVFDRRAHGPDGAKR